MRSLFFLPSLSSLLFALSSLVIGGSAMAQEGTAGIPGIPGAPWALQRTMQQDFEGRDLPIMVEMLQLDAAQQEALNEAFRSYEASFSENARTLRELLPSGWTAPADRPDRQAMEEFRIRMQELIEEMRKAQDALPEGADLAPVHERFREQVQELREQLSAGRPQLDAEERLAVTEQAAAALDRWYALNLDLKQRFAAQVQALLREKQRPLWPALEQRLTRQKTLQHGRLAGESIDLVSILDELALPEEVLESLRPTIDEYYGDLHAALITRNEYLNRTERDLQRAMAGGEQSEIESIASRRIQMNVLVREVNDRYAELFATRLPGDASRQFVQLYGSLAYPQIYRPTRAERMFRAARLLIGLNEAQLIAIDDLLDAYLVELERMNRALVVLFRETEPERMALGTRARTTDQDERMRAALRDRTAMGDRAVEQLQAILSPDQRSQLPDYRSPRR